MAIANAGLIELEGIVGLAGVGEMRASERFGDGSVRLGAMRLHRETAADGALAEGQRVLADAAGQIANPAIRNMGTLGGSVAFADPAADYLPALLVADAVLELAGPDGRREVAAQDFFLGWMETALQENEMIVAVRVPPAPPGSIGIYRKMARVAGDFATIAVALVLKMDYGKCADIRIGIGGCNPHACARAGCGGCPVRHQPGSKPGQCRGGRRSPMPASPRTTSAPAPPIATACCRA